MAEIGRQLNYDSNNISRCCSNLIKTYKGYIWVKKKRIILMDIWKNINLIVNTVIVKNQFYNLIFFGNKLNEYFSAKEASVNIKEGGHSMISKVASGKNPQAFGYMDLQRIIFRRIIKGETGEYKNY